jgi:hypothetical protein
MLYVFSGINAYVIAFTALAGGTSWPDLVASKIAAERQTTADSAIANITCRCHSKFNSNFRPLLHINIRMCDRNLNLSRRVFLDDIPMVKLKKFSTLSSLFKVVEYDSPG